MKTGTIKIVALLIISSFFISFQPIKQAGKGGVISIETNYTITKVRTATSLEKNNYIVASSYEGTVLGVSYKGEVLWENTLSGYMNHDLWCADITNDGIDEILAANADGTIYCLNALGKLLWKFKANNAPMYSVCTIKNNNKTYVVCGGFDKNMYYLSPQGKQIKKITSYNYSIEKPWRYSKAVPDNFCHLTNFIRPVRKSNGTEVLAVNGVIHTMAIQGRGSLYLFKPLEEKPYDIIKLEGRRPLGEFKNMDIDNDGNEELVMGTSSMIDDATLLQINLENKKQTIFPIKELKSQIDNFGYRVVQSEVIEDEGQKKFLILFGSRILLGATDFNQKKTEVLTCKYSFNDMWKDKKNDKIILASVQSGGSCIHVIDTKKKSWKKEYQNLKPKGKISKIIENTASIRKNLKTFKAPKREKSPRPVYLMSESKPQSVLPIINHIEKHSTSPVFLNSAHFNRAESFDRSYIKNEFYRNRRDRRRTYNATSKEVVNHFTSKYKGGSGLSFWGGHGNDPYMFRRSTLEKILNQAKGKKTVLVFPELEDHSNNFAYVMNDYFYPLANHCKKTNGQIYVRTKHSFWQANIYLPIWSRVLSGEFSEVFVPAMEETTDKSMELSISSRLGIWASGAVNSWGSRCARDNPSFDRLRQHSHQMLPNHFLRNMIYHISHGAQYLNNFTVDQKYMSVLWELIAKGALYVPERHEIVSFSPVHISMLKPDEHYLDRSSNVKWTTFYNQEFEENNPFVFSRLSGSWPGAPVTEWDFSNYAAGVKDRHLNFLPPYKNGMVLLTPPQKGSYANKTAKRGKLVDHLHPIYKNIMKEFYTDGRYYYSANGNKKYKADTYYKEVEKSIKEKAKLVPLTVSGNGVAWVVAQTAPKHLRLTIIDGGYINPNKRQAKITFNTVSPIKMTDILENKKFDISNSSSVEVDVPLGMARFIDIELKNEL